MDQKESIKIKHMPDVELKLNRNRLMNDKIIIKVILKYHDKMKEYEITINKTNITINRIK